MSVLQPTTNQSQHPFKRLKPNPLPSTRYGTLKREHNFRHPSAEAPHFPDAQELIRPHVDSFNTLFDADGLLDLGIKDLDEKVIFDGKPVDGKPLGNKLSSPSRHDHV